MLLTEFHGHANTVVAANPADAFATITDVDRLPQWNKRIARILRAPTGPLGPDVEWTIQMSVPPVTWPSRSRVVAHEPDRMYFEHISQSDDGNPSYGVWRWSVMPAPGGAQIAVEWSVHPKTFWRRLLFGRMRRHQLAEEVPASLAALTHHLASSDAIT